ncbi:hypothetical protein [Paracoccus sediminicola]|uniref:hypothetical protein n=1 Tax=Paracoccus sediminicola TaxID=3017783 RepID=UPI0022F12AEE|nr:hypothetical protein [Paracoccus sediminicola]WBU57194.1 hypothetical protein PAF18_01735 [Paracoccus sediminicola]
MANQITPFPPTRSLAPSRADQAPRHSPVSAPQPPQQGEPRRSEAPAERLQGFAAIMQDGLGQTRLPNALELVAALDAARDHAAMADKAVPGLGKLVSAVIEDESRKLARYLDLRGV